MFGGGNGHSRKHLVDEMESRGNVGFGKCVVREMLGRGTVQLGKCLSGNCPSRKSPLGELSGNRKY